jgi:hypothetical protein
MRKILFLLILLCIEKSIHAQYVYTIKADSVKITNSCDTAELIIENHTQTVPGFLFNKGRGRTEFRRGLMSLNESVFLIGADTLDLDKILGGRYYKQGGNSFGTTALFGTKDNFPLTFLQNNRETARVDTSGHWLFNTTEDKGYLAQFKGDIWNAGRIYQDKNISIVPIGGVVGDKRIDIGGNFIVGHGSIALGSGVQVNGSGVTSFGLGLANTVVDGIGIFGSTDKGIAIGHGSYAHANAIALGFAAMTTADNQFVCGGPDHDYNTVGQPPNKPITNVFFGSGVQRSNIPGPGIAYTINGSGAYDANYAGGNITIAGGKGTGAGTPGSIIFATAQSTSPGSALQNLSERARIDANGNLGIGNNTPSAMLHVSGTGRFDNTVTTSGHRSAIRNVSGNTTIGDTDEYIFVNTTSTSVTITLPTAIGRDGQIYTIKRINAGSNPVTITNNSSQLIDGMNSVLLTSQWAFITVVANGSTWMIVSR